MSKPRRLQTGETVEERYRLLVDAITDYAIYMLDADGCVVSWNSGAERFKGYRAEEILGRHFSQFYTPEDRAAGEPQRVLGEAAREGRAEREGWRVRKDGRRFWAHVVVDAIRGAEGEVIGFAKITRDLTERRAAEAALKRSEDQFRLLVQGVTDYAIFMLEPDGRVASWNAGAERIKGYAPEEIIGEHFSRFYTEADRAAGLPQRSLEVAAETGRCEREGLRVRKDGTTFEAHVVLHAIRDEGGEVVGFAKVTRDVTAMKASQRELESAREALFQAQKMEALGQLTGGVAHDFNNLLTAAQGGLELVKKRMPHDPRLSPMVDNALEAVRRGAVLTQRMLAFARRQELRTELTDVARLLGGMLGFLQRSISPAIRIECMPAPELPKALTDPAQLESAILNLVLNARDAIVHEGRIVLSARAARLAEASGELKPGVYVVLSVEDDGCGMPEEVRQRAIEPFFTTKELGRGTGLGLSTAHGLASQSGGRLLIHSRPGEGTRIEIWLPAAMAEGEDAAEALTAAALEARRVVLAVDDDPLVLANTVALLEDLGYLTLEAASARQALEILARHDETAAVVTDYAMPGMSGDQLRAEIARRRPDLPVLIVTGYAHELGGRLGLHLKKPFTQDQLGEALEGLIGVARPATAAPVEA